MILLFYCSVCGAELSRETIEIPKKNHTPGDAVEENRTDATCTAAGSYDSVVYCSVCGAELSRETVEIPKKNHTPGDAVEENRTDATCTVAGSYDSVVYCSVCGAELSRETVAIPKKDHTPGDAVEENRVEASCTEDGSYESVVYCSVCGEEVSRETVAIPATGHTPGEAVRENEVPATVSQAGSYDEVVYCKVCGAEISRTPVEVPVKAHAALQSITASFDGMIRLNYYISVPEELAAGAYAEFTVGDETKQIAIADAKYVEKAGGYKFSISMLAAQVKDNVNIRLYSSDGTPVDLTSASGTTVFTETGIDYSVENYLNNCIDYGNTAEDAKALAKDAKDYCYTVSNYFNSTDYALSDNVDAVTNESLGAYTADKEGEIFAGFSVKKITAMFESDNTLRMYLSFTAGTDGFTFEVDGKPAALQMRESDGMFYLAAESIAAAELHKDHRFKICKGEDSVTLIYSALAYANDTNAKYGAGNEKIAQMCKATYLYNQAAKQFFHVD